MSKVLRMVVRKIDRKVARMLKGKVVRMLVKTELDNCWMN